MTQTTRIPTWTIGDRLRKAREWADIESRDMAERLGVSRNTISNYEHDRTSPPVEVLKLWATETGVNILWLLDAEDEIKKYTILGSSTHDPPTLFTLAA